MASRPVGAGFMLRETELEVHLVTATRRSRDVKTSAGFEIEWTSPPPCYTAMPPPSCISSSYH